MQQPPNPSDKEDAIQFRQTWDTSEVPPSERFSYYREGICQAYFAMSPELPAGCGIDARIEVAKLPTGIISSLSASPHRNCRTGSDVAKIESDFLGLNLQHNSIKMTLDRGAYTVKPGSIVLLDHSQTCQFDLMREDERIKVNLLLFPRHLINDYFGSRDVVIFDRYALQALRSCLVLMETQFKNGSRLELANIFDASISLLTAALIKDRDFLEERCTHKQSVADGLFEAVKAYIEENAWNPDLCVLHVANRFCISSRYIHKLFERDKTTFKSYITSFRLSNLREELISETSRNKTVAELAFKWGFRDITTFYRNFKSAFDETPYRMQRFRKRPDGAENSE